jgi:hypothetical protein
MFNVKEGWTKFTYALTGVHLTTAEEKGLVSEAEYCATAASAEGVRFMGIVKATLLGGT